MPLSPLALIDRWLAPAPAPARVGWLRGTLFAHRGLHGPGVPENSLSAYAAAIARGIGIECDVQKSGDGQPIVFHDWELDRLRSTIDHVERERFDAGTGEPPAAFTPTLGTCAAPAGSRLLST